MFQIPNEDIYVLAREFTNERILRYQTTWKKKKKRVEMHMHPGKTFCRFPTREKVTVSQKGKKLGCLELCSPSTIKLNTKSLLNHA